MKLQPITHPNDQPWDIGPILRTPIIALQTPGPIPTAYRMLNAQLNNTNN
jgi:hypothetical protein